MRLFELFATIGLDTSGFESGIDRAIRSGNSFSDKIGKAFDFFAKGTIITEGIGRIADGLNRLEEESREFIQNQARVNTSMMEAGFSAEQASEQYKEFYGILGDPGQATEATQLLSQLATDEKNLADWTTIATGAMSTFGDSLPTEGLIEYANESVKTGELVGDMERVFLEAGYTVEEVNEKLASLGTEQERNAYLTSTLVEAYSDSAEAYREANGEIIAYNENQARQDKTIAKVGEAVLMLKNAFFNELYPVFEPLIEKSAEFLANVDPEAVIDSVVSFVETFVDLLPVMTGVTTAAVAFYVAINQGAIVSAVTGAISGMKTAVLALNTAMNANPIGLVVSLIAGLVAAFITAYATSEDFRNVVNAVFGSVWEVIKTVVGNIVDFFTVDIPNAFNAVVNFFKNNWQDILVFLVNPFAGVVNWLYKNNDTFREWADGVIQSIKDAFANVFEIGQNIAKGIWNGIDSMGDWIYGKVSGFVEGIKGVFTGKNGFDIHSPSRWSKYIVEMVAQGMVNEFDSSGKVVVRSAQEVSKGIMDALSSWVDDKKFYNEMSLQDELEYWNEVKNIRQLQADELSEIDKKIYTLEQDILDENQKKMEEQQAQLETYVNNLESKANSIANTFGIFGSVTEQEAVSGKDLISNLEEQIDELTRYQENVAELSAKGINSKLLEELESQGVGANAQIEALLNLSDADLEKTSALYAEKINKSMEIAKTQIEPIEMASAMLSAPVAEIDSISYATATSGMSETSQDSESLTEKITAAVVAGLVVGLENIRGTIEEMLDREFVFQVSNKEFARFQVQEGDLEREVNRTGKKWFSESDIRQMISAMLPSD